MKLNRGKKEVSKWTQHRAFKHFLFVGSISFIPHPSCQLLIFLLSDTNSIWLTDIICLLTASVFNLFGFAAPPSISQLRNLSLLTGNISRSYSSWTSQKSTRNLRSLRWITLILYDRYLHNAIDVSGVTSLQPDETVNKKPDGKYRMRLFWALGSQIHNWIHFLSLWAEIKFLRGTFFHSGGWMWSKHHLHHVWVDKEELGQSPQHRTVKGDSTRDSS